MSAGLRVGAAEARFKTYGSMRDGAWKWDLYSHGMWEEYVRFAKAGRYRVRVVCYGAPVNGEWPVMRFAIDDAPWTTVTVTSDTPTEYEFEFEAEAKVYRIGLEHKNKARTEAEEKELYIMSMTVESADGGPQPTLGQEEVWVEQGRRGEEETLERTADEIEKNRKSDATLRVVDEQGRAVQGAEVEVELERHEFLFGANFYRFDNLATPEQNETYKRLFLDVFNYATLGFYWKGYEPERGKPKYEHTDKVVAWCREHHIRVKGHPLLWAHRSGVPAWSQGQPGPETQKARVQEIVKRFAGKIDFWEVVNEPVHETGVKIDEPYRWAREADPKAKLIVNEYDVMAHGYPEFYELLEKAIENGVPFDGIGMQAHEPMSMRFPLERVWKVLEKYGGLGKELSITEFTPPSGVREITGSHLTGTWDEAAQADYAEKFYRTCFAHPKVVAITWWDVNDYDNMFSVTGGLLRKDLSQKPAYETLRRLIREEWTTKVKGRTDKDGKMRFRGFKGDYAVRVRAGGRGVEGTFRLRGGEQAGELETINFKLESD